MGGVIQHNKAIDFILGGNSTFTVLNTKTKNRFTFKVKKHNKGNIFFVKILTNPEIYTFIGSIIENKYKHSGKSTINQDAQSVKVFSYILRKLSESSLEDFIEIWHEGRCGRCGRELTVPSSIESGFGPECIKRIKL